MLSNNGMGCCLLEVITLTFEILSLLITNLVALKMHYYSVQETVSTRVGLHGHYIKI